MIVTVLGDICRNEERNGVAFSSCSFETMTVTALQMFIAGSFLASRAWSLKASGEQRAPLRWRKPKASESSRARMSKNYSDSRAKDA
jgi:hypothetical protein